MTDNVDFPLNPYLSQAIQTRLAAKNVLMVDVARHAGWLESKAHDKVKGRQNFTVHDLLLIASAIGEPVWKIIRDAEHAAAAAGVLPRSRPVTRTNRRCHECGKKIAVDAPPRRIYCDKKCQNDRNNRVARESARRRRGAREPE